VSKSAIKAAPQDSIWLPPQGYTPRTKKEHIPAQDGASIRAFPGFRIDEFEKLFTAARKKSAGKGGKGGKTKGGRSGMGATGDAKKAAVRLLDFKRATNLGIALKRLKAPPAALAGCLRGLHNEVPVETTGDATGLSVRSLGPDDLEILVGVIPTPDELATLR